MIYRTAQTEDNEQVARLHAESWRRTYRGLFSDEFLDNQALADRKRVWHERLMSKRRDQYVCVAEHNGSIKGFICTYGNSDNTWGSLIDNLHVAFGHQGCGIGTALMNHAFSWLYTHYPRDSIYLWVMERNHAARQFYEKLGASNAGVIDKPNPVGGGSARNCRYVWTGPVQHTCRDATNSKQ